MPRKARIDTSEAVQHIICRGAEVCKIFRDDTDRDSFVDGLTRAFIEVRTICYGWKLIKSQK
jgi:hypothetical protein